MSTCLLVYLCTFFLVCLSPFLSCKSLFDHRWEGQRGEPFGGLFAVFLGDFIADKVTLGHLRRERRCAASHKGVQHNVPDVAVEQNQAERQIEWKGCGMRG